MFGATRIGLPPQVNVIGTMLFLAGVSISLGNVALARIRARWRSADRIVDALMTLEDRPDVEVIESDIEPGGNSGEELHSFNADTDVINVLKGKLEVATETDRL